MAVDETVNKLIRLPILFKSLGNVSMYDLLKRSGYFETHEQVIEQEILRSLSEHPECADAWIEYSEDKRCAGWYLRKEPEGIYSVGYLEKGPEQKLQAYTSKMEACAAYIKREAEDIMAGGKLGA